MTPQLTHDPFSDEARKLGSYGTEISKYSACLKRWADFFLLEARLKQAEYEKARKKWLLEQATHNRKKFARKTRKSRVERIFKALISAGLSEDEAMRIASM